MSKQKVKVEITNTYYFTPEQWAHHDTERTNTVSEYLADVCLPQETQVEIVTPNIPSNEGEKEEKKDTLFG
tara:strand:- start:635 stop:847 length:213 start_codon:yes stop_codon:yes gene_type:complete